MLSLFRSIVAVAGLLLLQATGCNAGHFAPVQTIQNSGLELDVSEVYGRAGTRVFHATVVLRNTTSKPITFDLRDIHFELGKERVPATVVSIDRGAPTEVVIHPARYSKRVLRKLDTATDVNHTLRFELERVAWRKLLDGRFVVQRARS
jgi:hypothetical protein